MPHLKTAAHNAFPIPLLHCIAKIQVISSIIPRVWGVCHEYSPDVHLSLPTLGRFELPPFASPLDSQAITVKFLYANHGNARMLTTYVMWGWENEGDRRAKPIPLRAGQLHGHPHRIQ
jgi:hypothetical protein